MPPVTRRTRPSVPNTGVGLEDISTLSLPEVRSRLERNERVLNTSLFSSPAGSQFSTSPTSTFLPTTTSPPPLSPHQTASGSGIGGTAIPVPPSPLNDPFREKLLLVRQQLLEREQELLVQEATDAQLNGQTDGIKEEEMPYAESSTTARRRSSGNGAIGNGRLAGGAKLTSGKARALESIQAEDEKLAPNSIKLPYTETIALSDRDFEAATARTFASMSINPATRPTPPDTPSKTLRKKLNKASHALSSATESSSSNHKSRDSGQNVFQDYDPNDEIARAQAMAKMTAFMTYKGDSDDDEDEYDGAEGLFDMEGDYDGDGDKFALGSQGREPHKHFRGTGEDVDDFGEDDEEWAEGNDEYLDKSR